VELVVRDVEGEGAGDAREAGGTGNFHAEKLYHPPIKNNKKEKQFLCQLKVYSTIM
jgi:hypothetical protein